jgi:hypothetical protein
MGVLINMVKEAMLWAAAKLSVSTSYLLDVQDRLVYESPRLKQAMLTSFDRGTETLSKNKPSSSSSLLS